MNKTQIYQLLTDPRAKTLLLLEAKSFDSLFVVPRSQSWSPIMVLDHLRILDDQICQVLQRLIDRGKKKGITSPVQVLTKLKDLEPLVSKVMSAPAAPGTEPRNPPPSTIFLEANQSRKNLLTMIDVLWNIDIQEITFPHPWIGPMNGYEWLIFLSVHERGHHDHLQGLLQS